MSGVRSEIISGLDEGTNQKQVKLRIDFKSLVNLKTLLHRIPIDIQSTVYCTAVRADTDNSISNFVMNKYMEESGSQKTLLLNSLACSKNRTSTQT